MFIPGIVASMIQLAAGGITGQESIVSPVTTPRSVASNGAGNWVMGGAAEIAYSPDKINWTLTASTISSTVISIATDSIGNWVALADSGDIYTSVDNGVTWTVRTSLQYATATTISYHAAPDKFYVTGVFDHQVSSDKGVTWIDLNLANFSYQVSAPGGSRIVFAGDTGYSLYTDDGITWAAAGVPIQTIRGSWYGNGNFAFTSNSGLCYYSATGSGTWSSQDIDPSSSTAHNFIFYIASESRWVSSNNTGVWFESADLINWTQVTSGDFSTVIEGWRVADDSTGYIMISTDNTVIIKTVASTAFITNWDTTIGNETITLPTTSPTNNFTVDWGDNSGTEVVTTTNPSHVYIDIGNYDITITGICPTWAFSNGGDKAKIKDVKNWGNVGITSFFGGFHGCSNMTVTATDAGAFGNVTTTNRMFYLAPLVNMDVSLWDVSNVIDMTYMFRAAGSANPDVSSWDISNVTFMINMFRDSAFSNTNYDLLLAAWSQLTVTPSVAFHAGLAKYTEVAARAILTDPPNSWVITDGGAL